MKVVFDRFLKDLGGAIKGAGYYPSDHPARKSSLNRIYDFLLNYFSDNNSLTLSVIEDTLTVEETPFFETSPNEIEILNNIMSKGIGEIVFKEDLTFEELDSLISFLGMSEEDFENTTIEDFIISEGIVNISIIPADKDFKKRSKRVYSKAKKYIIDSMNDVRLGRVPQIKKANAIIGSVKELLQKDESAVMGLTLLSDYDNYTFNHSVNVGILSLSLAEKVGFGKSAEQIGLAGMLHDIGKTKTPLEIINKPGKLSEEEWEIMKKHPIDGAEIVQKMDKRPDVTLMILQHHVRYDLSGYPAKQKKLNEGTHLVTIADTYDSMTTLRPYQKRFDPKEALDLMTYKLKGTTLHPKYFEKFIEMLGIFPIGTCVRLKTGEVAVVKSINRKDQYRPEVWVIIDKEGNKLDHPIVVDLADNKNFKEREIILLIDPFTLGVGISEYL